MRRFIALTANFMALSVMNIGAGLGRAEKKFVASGGRQSLKSRPCSSFFVSLKAAGKAVKIGYSCAAVTHQSRPPPRGEHARKANRPAAGEGGGEAALSESEISNLRSRNGERATHAKSEDSSLSAHALARFACAGRENFIAKMKRGSSTHDVPDVVGWLLP